MSELVGGMKQGELAQSLSGIRSVQSQIADRQRQIDQVKANSAQDGRVSLIYTTTGTGNFIEPTCFSFGAVFTDRPFFSVGAEVLGEAIVPPPMVWSATIYKWRTNKNGFYTGAYVEFYVSSLSSGGGAGVQMDFHLSWNGIVINDFISSPSFPVSSLDS